MLSIPSQSSLGFYEFFWYLLVLLYSLVLGWSFIQKIYLLIKSREYGQSLIWSARLPMSLGIFFSASVGLALATQLLFVIGLLGMLTKPVACVGFIILLLVLFPFSRSVMAGARSIWLGARKNLRYHLAILCSLLVIGLACTWRSCGVPGLWDDASFHLPLARFFVEEHSLAVNPWLRFPLFPANANLLFAFSLFFERETFAQVVANAVPFSLTALGIYGACEYFLKSRFLGGAAVAVFLNLPVFRETMGYAYIDSLFMLFCWGAVLAMVMAVHAPQKGISVWAVVCAICAGVAIGTKLFGVIVVFGVGLIYLVKMGWKNKNLYVLIGLTIVFGIGWYLRSFIISGDPIHPAGGNIFGHYIWTSDDLRSQQSELNTWSVGAGPLGFFASLYKAGLLWMLVGLFIIFQRRTWKTAVWPLAILVLVYLLLWQRFFPPPRYTYPIVPVAIFLAAAFFYYAGYERLVGLIRGKLGIRVLYFLIFTPLFVSFVFGMYYSYEKFKNNRYAWIYMESHPSGEQKIMNLANSMVAEYGPTLLQIGYEKAIYLFKGKVLGDWFGLASYFKFISDKGNGIEINSAENLKNLMEGMNVNMVAINAERFRFIPQSYTDFFEVREAADGHYLLALKDKKNFSMMKVLPEVVPNCKGILATLVLDTKNHPLKIGGLELLVKNSQGDLTVPVSASSMVEGIMLTPGAHIELRKKGEAAVLAEFNAPGPACQP